VLWEKRSSKSAQAIGKRDFTGFCQEKSNVLQAPSEQVTQAGRAGESTRVVISHGRMRERGVSENKEGTGEPAYAKESRGRENTLASRCEILGTGLSA